MMKKVDTFGSLGMYLFKPIRNFLFFWGHREADRHTLTRTHTHTHNTHIYACWHFYTFMYRKCDLFAWHIIFCPCFFVDFLEMGCSQNDTTLDITIPVVMLTKSRGAALNESMASGRAGDLLSSDAGYYLLSLMLFDKYESLGIYKCISFQKVEKIITLWNTVKREREREEWRVGKWFVIYFGFYTRGS